MKQITKEEIEKTLKKLPVDLQEAFFSPEVAENILAIGKKFNLTVIKMGELYSETNGVMLGFTPPKDYVKNLMASLQVDQAIAKEIAEEVNQRVFKSVRNSLKRIHGLTGPEEKKELKPEVIMPTGNTIAIKSEKEEMDRIDVAEEIPMMQVFAKGVPPASKKEPAPAVAKPVAPKPPLTFAEKPKTRSIDEMLDDLGGRPAPAVPKPSESSTAIKSGIEKVLGGEIRQGTVSPQIPPTPPKPRNDPYREPI